MILKKFPSKVKIVEVGPRDGLQNEKTIISLEDKLEYIRLLSLTGLETIEVTSFVSPKAIPQMQDSELLYSKVTNLVDKKINLPVLVPNVKGMENALKSDVKEIALFSATSDEFTKKNINCTVDESFVRMKEVAQMAHDSGIKIRGYISTAFGCPYAGYMSKEKLLEVSKRFLDLGVYEISIGDTIGIAHPAQVDEYLEFLLKDLKLETLAMHFHDTRGMAIANILMSLQYGISIFDSSSAGLGGCPYAKGATGNVGTEDVYNLCNTLGIQTGINLEKLVAASRFILARLGKESSSRFYNAMIKSDL